MKNRLHKFDLIEGLVFVIYFCIFILPSSYFNEMGAPITKYIYLIYILFMYFVMSVRGKNNIKEIFLLIIIFLIAILNNSLNIVNIVGVLVGYRLISNNYTARIKEVVLNTHMNYIALFATVFYSIYYYKLDGNRRLVRTAVGEINQSGLAIFCLGMIFRKKKKWLGNIVMALGVLSFSRNYVLAILIYFILNISIIKHFVIKYKLEKKFSFLSITFISTIILVILGGVYQYLYRKGMISFAQVSINRLFNLVDMANYYRFTANMYLGHIFIENPLLFLKGIPDLQVYQNYCYEIAGRIGYLFSGNTPHNFFFSYLRIYGGFIIVIFFYISKIMKSIVNYNNFGVFLAIMSYAIFLSAGFNTFWLYLTLFTLLVYEDEKNGRN